MEIPGVCDEHGDSIIEGVESENVEEINDAYRDMITEIGTPSKSHKNQPSPTLS